MNETKKNAKCQVCFRVYFILILAVQGSKVQLDIQKMNPKSYFFFFAQKIMPKQLFFSLRFLATAMRGVGVHKSTKMTQAGGVQKKREKQNRR